MHQDWLDMLCFLLSLRLYPSLCITDGIIAHFIDERTRVKKDDVTCSRAT